MGKMMTPVRKPDSFLNTHTHTHTHTHTLKERQQESGASVSWLHMKDSCRFLIMSQPPGGHVAVTVVFVPLL